MQVAIRTDASSKRGTGHVMRCLVLANLLRDAGAEVVFICRPGMMNRHIAGHGFPLIELDETGLHNQAQDAERTAKKLAGMKWDWLVVDHYDLDIRWERVVSDQTRNMMVIDDLGNRPHQCDLLLDQYDLDGENRHDALVPARCRLLVGLRYLLLDTPFLKERRTIANRSGKIERMLVFYGGSDPTGETEKVLKALQAVEGNRRVDVVIGQANTRASRIRELCRISGYSLHTQTADMACLIARADFALGAGGVSMWERCYLGLPSMVTAIAANQHKSIVNAERHGAIWNIGSHKNASVAFYERVIRGALRSQNRLKQLSENALHMTDCVWHGAGRHPVVAEMFR